MYKIAICVPTFKRPLMLKKLLWSIIECKINRSLIKDVNIIIVDNDIDRTAEIIVNEPETRSNGIFKLHYFNHPVKGLSNVRNELIKRSLLLNPDFIVFIDDDEYATADWLNELINTIVQTNGDMARGPVVAVFDHKVSEYISCWFKRPDYPDNSQVKSVTAGNLIIRTKSLIKLNIWFDYRFNNSGSEDSYFGVQMLSKGSKIYWATNALVYETIQGNRANINWLIKRIFRNASTFSYVLKLEKKYLQSLKKILVSALFIILGIFALILVIIPVKKRYWGILKLSEGIGGLSGLLSIKYDEYK
jgi:succinoglycan biosynthesis protein ExoM